MLMTPSIWASRGIAACFDSLSRNSMRREANTRPSNVGLGTTRYPIRNPVSFRCLTLFLTVSSSTPSFAAISMYDFLAFQMSGEPQSSLMRSEYDLSRSDKVFPLSECLSLFFFPLLYTVQKRGGRLGLA